MLFYALNVGRSENGIGFNKGKHRNFEIGVPKNRSANPSGLRPKSERTSTGYVRMPR